MKYIPNPNMPTQPPHPALQFYKINPDAFDPQWGTEFAACFDLRACLTYGIPVNSYNRDNEKVPLTVLSDATGPHIVVEPKSRVMVPTGLMFDIPVGFSVRLHSRSGLALKQALVLANHEGVIDSDYVDPTYVVLTNNSRKNAVIYHGDRIGQEYARLPSA